MRVKLFRMRERPRGVDLPSDVDDASSGALRSIDRALRDLEGRRLLSSAEVVDLLLDLRSEVVLDTAVGQWSDELEVR